MGFKEAIVYFRNRIRKNKNDNLEEMYHDCPEVIIDDKILTVTLGQWMGRLPDSVKSGGNGMYVISHLDADELVARKMISKEDLELIKKRFANLLRMAGFGKGNTCILNNFNDDELTFKCNFSETGEGAEMRIRFGSWIDNGPELVVDFDGINTVYDYSSANEEHPDKLYIQSVTKDIDGKDKKFHHYASQFTYYGDVYDNENRVYVKIDYPEMLEKDVVTNPYIDKEKMEEALSAVTFPVNIEDLCNKVASALLVDSKDLKKISITVKKMDGRKELNVTNQVEFSNGSLVKLIITRNGKTVTLSNFAEWSYDSEKYAVSQTNDKNISYGFKGMAIDELDTMPTPKEMIEVATNEVEEVRTLARKLLQKNNN